MSSGDRAIDPADASTAGAHVAAVPGLFPVAGSATAVVPHGPRPLFAPDGPLGSDDLGRAEQAHFLAELLAHKRAETPFCLALFGTAGSGKSFFLNRMLESVARLSGSAARLGDASPFLPDILAVRVDAAASSDPGVLLARGVFDALVGTYPRLAAEARHAGGDPVRAAREIGESLNEARRRLDAERQTLDSIKGREARLSESVLFEAAGSRVDAYARSKRSSIERSLRAFGFTSADPVATYKDLVREAAESGGSSARIAISLRALWAYQGQTRLLVYAVILAFVAWGAGALQGDQQNWISAIRGMGEKAAPAADWAQNHVHWLRPLGTAATVLAVLALVWNVLRAARFLQPVFKGVSLLRLDVEARRSDLNGLLAHQTRRVDALAAEVEASASQAEDAERRADAHKAAGLAPSQPSGRDAGPFAAGTRDATAAFFAGLGEAMTAAAGGKPSAPTLADAARDVPRLEQRNRAAPRRIVLAIDGLDQVPSERAADLVRAAHRLLRPGFVAVLAAERDHLAAGFAETDPALAAAQLGRSVQLAYHLGASTGTDESRATLARSLIEGRSPAAAADVRGFDATHSTLDEPWRPGEAETVVALARFAGETPRTVKRFVNVYRIARADPKMRDAEAPVFTALALALALAAHGYPDDVAALESASQGETPRDATVLREALAAVRAASGVPVELAQAQQALAVARHYMA